MDEGLFGDSAVIRRVAREGLLCPRLPGRLRQAPRDYYLSDLRRRIARRRPLNANG